MRQIITIAAIQLQLLLCLLGIADVDVNADLTISGPRCGVFTCQKDQYCSSFDNQCKNCADICDKNSHNFDEKECVQGCQDFLHDSRYVKITSNSGNAKAGVSSTGDNSQDINQLYTLVTTALTLLILLILLNAAYAIYKCYTWAKKNDIKANNILSYFKRENERNEDVEKASSPNGLSNASTVTAKRDLRLHITNTSSPHSEQPTATSPATMTTSISRRPAEDSALDYAYDNHAMSGTPSPHSGKTQRESNF